MNVDELTNWRQFLCVCPVIDHKFRHHIVKVAVDPQGDSKLSNFPLSLADASHEFQIHVCLRILTIKINQWARVNFCSYRKMSWSWRNTRKNNWTRTAHFLKIRLLSFFFKFKGLQNIFRKKLKDVRYLSYLFRICKGRFTRYDFVACGKFTTGLRHELFRVSQSYNSLTTVVYEKKIVLRF